MCCRLQKGFTLAEVLASVFLLVLGIIGAAGMQLQALRTAQQSAFRTVALSLATEMADAMRLTLSTSNSQILLKPYLEVDFRSSEHSTGLTPNCYFFPCTSEQIVKFNIEEWKQRIENALPEGRAKICLDTQASGEDKGLPDWTCGAPQSKKAPFDPGSQQDRCRRGQAEASIQARPGLGAGRATQLA